MKLPHAGSMPPIPPSQAESNATDFPPWVLAGLDALPADVLQQVQAQGLDSTWPQHLLEGLGGAPLVPIEAWPNLMVWLRWIVPPLRFHMASAAVQAVGVHARRHGWGAVQRFFDGEDGEVARPPYAVFAWMLRRLLAGANAVDVDTIDDARVVAQSQRALGLLFAGCDLAELHDYEMAWKEFVITGGRSREELEPPPALIEWISLAGGEVMGHQLLKQEAFGSGHRAYLWPAVCSGQVIAFQLEPEQPFAGDITLVYRPTLAGGWDLQDRPQGDMVWPQLQLAVIELGEALARVDLPQAVRQYYLEAAVRCARYSPAGSLYSHIDRATPGELAAVGQWFPKGEHPLNRLRHVWQAADSPDRNQA